MRRFRKSSVLINAPNKTDLTVLKSNGADRNVQAFTRATTGTYIDSAGLVQTAASGVARFNKTDGLLVEPVATNILTYSEYFTNVVWVAVNVTVSANAIAAPDGTTTADKIIETAITNTFQKVQSYSVTAGNTYTFSVFAKAAERTFFQISYSAASPTIFNLSTGVVSSTPINNAYFINARPRIEAYPNGWYRCSVTLDCIQNLAGQVRYALQSDSSTTSYAGDITKGIYLWGAQAQTTPFITSYTQTTSAGVTRNADILTISTANFKTEQGKLKFDFTPTHNSTGTVALGGSYVDASNYTQLLHTSGTGYIFRKRIAGVNYDAVLNAEFVANTTYNIELRWSNVSGTDVFVNGVRGTNNPDKQIIQLSTLWQIGSDGNSLQQAGASFKNLISSGKHPTVIDTKTYLTDENSVAITDENSNPIYTIL